MYEFVFLPSRVTFNPLYCWDLEYEEKTHRGSSKTQRRNRTSKILTLKFKSCSLRSQYWLMDTYAYIYIVFQGPCFLLI